MVTAWKFGKKYKAFTMETNISISFSVSQFYEIYFIKEIMVRVNISIKIHITIFTYNLLCFIEIYC